MCIYVMISSTKDVLNLCLSINLNYFFLFYSVKDESTWRTNKYSDVSQFPDASTSNMQVWERRLLYCVPVCCL